MSVVAIVSDLLMASRIEGAASGAGVPFARIDSPADLPTPEAVRLVLIDWSARRDDWARQLSAWRESVPAGSSVPRVVLFGQHTDLEAHSAARAVGLGPMWARSKLVAELPALVAR